MARGFLGALDSFAGGFAQGYEKGEKLRIAREQAAREQEEHEWKRQAQQRVEQGLAAVEAARYAPREGYDVNTGLTEQQINELYPVTPAAPERGGRRRQPAAPAPVPAAAPAPAPIAGLAAAEAAAAPAPARAPAPATPALGVPTAQRVPAPIQTVDPDVAIRGEVAPTPSASPSVAAPAPAPNPEGVAPVSPAAEIAANTPRREGIGAPAETKAPSSRDDYVRIRASNGEYRYVPRTEIRELEGAELAANLGRALVGIDNTQALQAMRYAQELESGAITLRAQRWGEGVTAARRIGGEQGLNMIAELYGDMPNGRVMVPTTTTDDKGVKTITLTEYAQTDQGRTPTGFTKQFKDNPNGLSAYEQVFREAAGLATPEAMIAYNNSIIAENHWNAEQILRLAAQDLSERQFTHRQRMDAADLGLRREGLSLQRRAANAADSDRAYNKALGRFDRLMGAAGLDPNSPTYQQDYENAASNIYKANPDIARAMGVPMVETNRRNPPAPAAGGLPPGFRRGDGSMLLNPNARTPFRGYPYTLGGN